MILHDYEKAISMVLCLKIIFFKLWQPQYKPQKGFGMYAWISKPSIDLTLTIELISFMTLTL